MKIGILAAQTGNGHISVMTALKEEFVKYPNIEVNCFPSFYEDMIPGNKILSDFYNFLMINDINVCNKYCEFTALTRPDISENFLAGAKEFVKEFLLKYKFDILISVSHTINAVIINSLTENQELINTKFYIVVTDPFEPIAVGYNVPGANLYFCTNDCVKKILLKSGIEEEKININDYPLSEKYGSYVDKRIEIEKLQFSSNKKIVLLNAGSQGIYHYYNILKTIITQIEDIQIIVICGKNGGLYQRCKSLIEKEKYEKNIRLFGFVNNIEKYISIADAVITKPGANSIYESLYYGKPILIDALKGFLFQEKGVELLNKKYHFGLTLKNLEDTVPLLFDLLNNSSCNYIENIKEMHINNGTKKIVQTIIANARRPAMKSQP